MITIEMWQKTDQQKCVTVRARTWDGAVMRGYRALTGNARRTQHIAVRERIADGRDVVQIGWRMRGDSSSTHLDVQMVVQQID